MIEAWRAASNKSICDNLVSSIAELLNGEVQHVMLVDSKGNVKKRIMITYEEQDMVLEFVGMDISTQASIGTTIATRRKISATGINILTGVKMLVIMENGSCIIIILIGIIGIMMITIGIQLLLGKFIFTN